MPAYLIVHPAGQRREDMLLEDDQLTVDFTTGWAIFHDGHGICLALPAELGAMIQRVDEQQEPQDQEPAPQKE
ncbi:hypothetical protein C9F11_38400 [Streptomyces sp. YIM 121038]|uniref:hypothetical protein n=1 Tax=Streptomyces sp. YIM 121038 TaxID=2136401 RepID=UPI0011109824|nr:hypothetical protein [Streptomyces sp. YIM 121038]QCX81263.1 hypothetical protein C9F11_38400 [Streptomyces sp. YIM 121038]